MVITFNYKEGTKTITFAELQEAISDKNGSDLDCLVAPSWSANFDDTAPNAVSSKLADKPSAREET